jgi:hypothetical protein
MAVSGTLTVILIIRAAQLRPGDLFETLITRAAGVRKKNRLNAANYGIPCELWYPDGRDRDVSLHPGVRVRLMERATS